ncbi:hypothetical protein KDM41_08775 [bacterium]|nr:hypothetical protein [bacterium]
MASNKKILALICMTLAAVAFTGCSDDAATPAAPAIDTAPPAVPANVDLEYSAGAAVLSWDTNTVDSDLAGYIVTRERNGVSQTLVGTPSLIHTYVDTAPLQGASMYHVFAVDNAGNESAVTTSYLTIESGHAMSDLSD